MCVKRVLCTPYTTNVIMVVILLFTTSFLQIDTFYA